MCSPLRPDAATAKQNSRPKGAGPGLFVGLLGPGALRNLLILLLRWCLTGTYYSAAVRTYSRASPEATYHDDENDESYSIRHWTDDPPAGGVCFVPFFIAGSTLGRGISGA